MSKEPIPGSPILVSRPDLPPLDRYVEGLKRVWESRTLTNNGPIARDLGTQLSAAAEGRPVSLTANGALALELALEALGVRGDVVTTPFSFAATANAVVRTGSRPVFADVEPCWFTLDPAAVERAITPATRAILAVHIFGQPCDLEGLASVARAHGLPLIYDAAHASGVTVDGRPIAAFGDAAIFSFHATKPFHAVEGGMIVSADDRTKVRIDSLVNHGLGPDGEVMRAGTNAKLSELHALMGLLMLEDAGLRRDRRAAVAETYRARLAKVPGVTLPSLARPGVSECHSYFVIRIDASTFGRSAAELVPALAAYGIGTRRYFHPPLHRMRAYGSAAELPIAEAVSPEVLALPIGASLSDADVARVCDALCYLAIG